MSTTKKVKTTVKQAKTTVKKAADSAKKTLTTLAKKTAEKMEHALQDEVGHIMHNETGVAPMKHIKPVAKKISPVVQKREDVWEMRLHRVAGIMAKKGFATSVVGSLKEAANVVMKEILPATQAKTVSFGGSMTVVEAGLLDALKKTKDLEVLDTFDYSIGAEAMIELRRQSLLVDLYLASVNALTEDGMLMLLDGTGNRAAAVQFGPKKVVLIIGRNKLCNNMEEGIARVRKLAAPANAMRLNRKTPCTKTGVCMDCSSPERICSTWTMTVRSAPKERIHVILVNDEVGY